MKVTRYNNGYQIRCSEHEYDILNIAVDQIELDDPQEYLSETGHRRSWSRRTAGGSFMRIDVDRRTEK